MKLLGSNEEEIDEDKNCEIVPHLENIEVVFDHCNIIINKYQCDSWVLFTFVPNKSFAIKSAINYFTNESYLH